MGYYRINPCWQLFYHARINTVFYYYESPLLTGSEYTYRQTMGHGGGWDIDQYWLGMGVIMRLNQWEHLGWV